MTGIDDALDNDEPVSPWATGDIAVNAATAPIQWAVDAEAPPGPSSPARPVTPDDAHGAIRSALRRPLVLGALVTALALVVAIIAWPRGDGSSAIPVDTLDAPTSTEAEPSTTLAALPGVFGAEPTDVIGNSGAQPDRPTSIDLPDPVAAITQPTEIVMRTQDGLIHTLSLPSGNVRTVDVGTGASQDFGGGQAAIAPDAAMFGSYGSAPIIVPRSGPSIAVDMLLAGDTLTSTQTIPGGWYRDAEGATRFLVFTYGESGNGFVSVGTDGTVADLPGATLPQFQTSVAFGGERFIGDAGGVYRIEPDGTTTRFDEGALIAGSDDQLLIRECDANRVCKFVVRSTDAGDGVAPRVIDDPAIIESVDSIGYYYGAKLSPDGEVLAAVSSSSNDRLFIDFALSTVTPTPASSNFAEGGGYWAPDSSGTFNFDYGNSGLVFISRETSEFERFGAELGQVVSMGVRSPDAELVEDSLAVGPISYSAAPAGPVDIDLVTVGRIGGVTLLDLDETTATSWDAPSITGEPPRLFADGDRVVVIAANSNTAYASGFGHATPLADDQVPLAPVFPGPEAGLIWARGPEAASTIDQRLVTLDNAAVVAEAGAERLTVDDGEIIGSDSAGGIVFASGGDLYTSSRNGVQRLTGGELLAIGPSAAFVRECDDTLRCGVVAIDRSTGERTALNGIIDDAVAATPERVVSLVGSVSPDGGVALIQLRGADSAETEWVLEDLTAQTRTPVPAPLDGQPIVWNAASTYAAIATHEENLALYERSTASVIGVVTNGNVRGITAVSSAFVPASTG